MKSKEKRFEAHKPGELYWPDEIRLKMIERSEFYRDPKVYQYGYYDGFQKAIESYDSPFRLQLDEALLKIRKLEGYFDCEHCGNECHQEKGEGTCKYSCGRKIVIQE